MPISPGESYTDVMRREEKVHGQVAFPAACYCVAFPQTDIAVHWHSELELIRVERGKIRLYAGSQRCILNAGMGVFVNSNVLHTAEAADRREGALIHSIVFSPRLVGGADGSIFWSGYLFPLLNNAACPVQIFTSELQWHRETLDNIQRAWIDIAEGGYGYEFAVRNELSRIILKLVNHQQQLLLPISRKMLRNEQRMKQMLGYIQEHYYERILLTDVAGAACVSQSECIRCFKDTLGTTPLQYVNRYRMQVAAQQLSGTDWQVSEIGYRCGFTEMGYFAAQFKKQYGKTPTEYRASVRENEKKGENVCDRL